MRRPSAIRPGTFVPILAGGVLGGLLLLYDATLHSERDLSSSVSEIAAQARHAVVNISTTQVVDALALPGTPLSPGAGELPPLGPPGEDRELRQKNLGSGFLISGDGLILTNAHVVEGAEQVDVKVRLASMDEDEEYRGRVVGTDVETDLALVKIEPRRVLPNLELGSSRGVQIGDWVVAIGNPFGLNQTVTTGVVGAKQRLLAAGIEHELVQTDAAINPGSSGGPLLNLDGEVVGISTAILTGSGGNVGVAFAIPSDVARPIVTELRRTGRVVRGWLGVITQDLTPALAEAFGVESERGALVAGVPENGPAARAGVRRGDVIASFGGRPVESSAAVSGAVARTEVGRVVPITVVRQGKRLDFEVEVGQHPESRTKRARTPSSAPRDRLGAVVSEIPVDARGELGGDWRSGLLVHSVEPGTPADDAGLLPGDVVLEVNRATVESPENVLDEVERTLETGDSLLILVARDGFTLFLATGGD